LLHAQQSENPVAARHACGLDAPGTSAKI
jgi:hypothetical protein